MIQWTGHSAKRLVQLPGLQAANAGGGRNGWEERNPVAASTRGCEPLEGGEAGFVGGGRLHGGLRRRHGDSLRNL